MKSEALGNFVIYDGVIEDAKNTPRFEEVTEVPLYEVVTVIDEIPLFFEEHIERLEHTAEMLGVELNRTAAQIEDDFYMLIEVNKIVSGNIKLIVNSDHYLVYQFGATHPTQKDLEDGIYAVMYDHERENPNAKLLYNEFKNSVAKYLEDTNAYEAILRSEDGELLEGSRTNLYFVKDGKVITAPANRVLRGITRSRLENVFKNLNLEILEMIVHDYELPEMEAAFFTGTTVDVVPIRAIESIELNSQNNEIVKSVIDGYRNLQMEYVKKKLDE